MRFRDLCVRVIFSVQCRLYIFAPVYRTLISHRFDFINYFALHGIKVKSLEAHANEQRIGNSKIFKLSGYSLNFGNITEFFFKFRKQR